MHTILPIDASGQPSRGRPRTRGRRWSLAARRRRRAAGASAAGVTSSMTRERSRSLPSPSMTPGRSAPARPNRTSFMPGRSGVADADDLADQGGLGLPLDLDGHLGADAHTVTGHFLGAGNALAHADSRAGLDRGDEANLVRAVVDAAAALLDLEQRGGHPRNERQREKPVGDRLAAGQLLLRPLDVDVDPLMVAGGFG